MSNASVRDFVSKVLEGRRIRYGDLRRLQRDILPEGITCREEAEALIGLDRSVEKTDADWPGYLSTALKRFVIARSNPPGCVDRATAEWLAASLKPRSRMSAAIVREIVAEAEQVDDVLLALAGASSKPVLPAQKPEAEPDQVAVS